MKEVFEGLGLLTAIAVVCMVVVLLAMVVDFVSGWRKAKVRGEARTSYGISRSFTKFLLYEGILFITCGMDCLVHFAWWQFDGDTIYCVPLISILGAIVLCLTEIMSVREKAEDKVRNRIDKALQTIVSAIGKEKAMEVIQDLMKKGGEDESTEEG